MEMRSFSLALSLLLISASLSLGQGAFMPDGLVCEYKTNPVGIDVPQPRLSWKILSGERGWLQGAYQLQVAKSADDLHSETGLVWDSGKVLSGASVHREYEGPSLRSSERYYWRVRVWDESGRSSTWSDAAFWEMGLLNPSDWKAKWITPGWEEDSSKAQPAPMLRGRFVVDQGVRSARAYVTSLGLYEIEINGRRVGDQLFTPGWTSYRHRLQYQTYDVTDYLRQGQNAVGVTLGDGWYRGVMGFEEKRNFYGEKLGLLVQIRMVYADGRVHIVGTDESWKASTGPILMSDIYMGETYDSRLEKPGWSLPDYDDREWEGVLALESPKSRLLAPAGPPVRRIEEIRPVEILRTPNGETVFDLGQNMVGWIKLAVENTGTAPGQVITLTHGEVLDGDGNLYLDNLRTATQRVQYILSGLKGKVVFEPHFTFQGFRFVAVEGLPGEPTLDSLTGVVIHSDMKRTGELETSHPMLNQLQRNIVWGQKGNFLDVPTDCPQRDERMGWTGDAQVFARTAAFNMDVASFFSRWLGDLAADQYPNGSIPWVVPDVLSSNGRGAGSTGWADAGVIIPWTLYLAYGDTRILENQYESMKAWVEFMREQAGSDFVWSSGFHFGDWLAFSTNNPAYPGATTGTDVIATAFFAYSTSLLSKTAAVLERDNDAREYERLLGNITEAFRREFVTESGRVAENTQTAYTLALMFDLLPDELRLEAAQRLADDVRERRSHLTTGFLGTPYINHVLTRFGHLDVAYDLLLQESYPSWLYPLTRGATTIWERWDGLKPDGTFQTPGMNSFNHYAYGAVGDWMYRVVAGIDTHPEAPGYKHVLIQPRPGGGLTHAMAALETMYGKVESNWQVEGDDFHLRVTIPANTTATVRIPDGASSQVRENGRHLEITPGIVSVAQARADLVITMGSGTYHFESIPQ